jgi:deoxyribonucleoside regulator
MKAVGYSRQEQMKMARTAQIAWLYYVHGENQQAIADKVGLNRTAVSRVLTDARLKGIVSFDVQYPWRDRFLENEITRRFGLDEAIVVVCPEKETAPVLAAVGMAAARWLGGNLGSATRISVSWGLSLRAMIEAIVPSLNEKLVVVQAIGATGTEANTSDGPFLAQRLAEKLGAQLQLLHAPLLVDNESVRDALLRDKHISAVLQSARRSDIAFVGVGLPTPDENNLVRAGYVTREQARELSSAGAVGDICARYYDMSGKLLDIDLNRRVMGVSPTEMEQVGKVVGVSAGPQKSRSVLGALRGQYLDVLVTDQTVAEYVLANREASNDGADPSAAPRKPSLPRAKRRKNTSGRLT